MLARVVAEVRGFPTVASGQPAVIVDLAWLGDVLAARSQPPLPVTQWWLRARPGVPAGMPPGAAVTTRAGLAAADAGCTPGEGIGEQPLIGEPPVLAEQRRGRRNH